MKGKDVIDLVLLAAVWGASFLFMRLGAPDFGSLGGGIVLSPYVEWLADDLGIPVDLVTTIPEPSDWILLGFGVSAMILRWTRRHTNTSPSLET